MTGVASKVEYPLPYVSTVPIDPCRHGNLLIVSNTGRQRYGSGRTVQRYCLAGYAGSICKQTVWRPRESANTIGSIAFKLILRAQFIRQNRDIQSSVCIEPGRIRDPYR